MKVRGRMRCPTCGARWSLVGEIKDNDELCPSCHQVGNIETDTKGVFDKCSTPSPAAESQERPPLPISQEIIRLATKLYAERVREFERSLDDNQRKSIGYAVERTLHALKLWSDLLERVGLPLEEDLDLAAETVSPRAMETLRVKIDSVFGEASSLRKTFESIQRCGRPG